MSNFGGFKLKKNPNELLSCVAIIKVSLETMAHFMKNNEKMRFSCKKLVLPLLIHESAQKNECFVFSYPVLSNVQDMNNNI